MRKKTRKFASGGDILNTIGAGMLGYALYKKLKGEDKDEKEPEAVGGAGRRPRTIEEQIGRKAEPKEETSDEKMASQEFPLTAPEKKVTPKKVVPKAEKPASQTVPRDDDSMNRRRLEGLNKPNANKTPTSGMGPKNTFLTKERLDKAQDSMRRYREEQKKKQRGVDEIQYDTMGNPTMKKGGKVKKYNSGGTTTSKPEPKKDTMPEWAKNERENRRRDELNKREAEGAAKEVKRNMSTFGFKKGGSASSRADGCAVRGKTRGKVY
jgi:hypothetical protein